MPDLRDPTSPTTTHAPPAQGQSLPASRVLAAFAAAQDVEQLLLACLAELRVTVPRLQPWRGRVSGRRALGAHTPSEHGRTVRLGYTRVDFEFEIHTATAVPEVLLTCRRTIRGRDLPATHARLPLGPDGGAAVAEWVEGELLEFTQRYVTRHAGQTRPSGSAAAS
jgi:hypothetical protein